MELRRHVVPSSYPSHQFPLDDPSGHLRVGARQPLTDSAGNSQLHALASAGLYHDNKELQSRATRPMYPTPTVPSLPPHQSVGQTWEQRRQRQRRRRLQRFTRNPIADSPQYQTYRKRQLRDRNGEDSKWPEVLEAAFLDALIEIPLMGRSKYSYKGKLHGRNELIVEYLWIAYLQSLPPGQHPDPTMMRNRKQVSSHIQVIKGFLKGHPAYHKLFPEAKDGKKGLENQSFKNDPCLRAISEGRLPHTRYDRFREYADANQEVAMHRLSMKPTHFWLFITSTSIPAESNGRDSKEDLYADGNVAHQCTILKSQRPSDSLESIPNWWRRFPHLQRLHSAGELQCDIIHMDVSLKLMSTHPPEGAELVSRTELSIPRGELESCVWQIVTTLTKPPELCRDPAVDPPVESQASWIQVLSVNEDEARIKIPFPANPWAHAFTNLADVQLKHQEKRDSFPGEGSRSVREYVKQISMYQEVQSASGPGMPFVRRAVIIWTFRKASSGEGNGGTYWRYLHPSPPRRAIMSPGPHPRHHISATMNENFSAFMEAPVQLQSQPQHQSNMMDDAFIHNAHPHTGLVTPPDTAGLQSPFGTQQFNFGASPLHQQAFDMPPENLSFSSTTTTESDSTLVETGHSNAASNLDHFLATTVVNLGAYEDPTNAVNHGWNIPVTESFDADPSWAGYGQVADVPPPHIGGWEVNGSEAKNHSWVEPPARKNSTEWHNSDVAVGQEKHHLEWISEDPAGNMEGHEWTGGAAKEGANRHDSSGTYDRAVEPWMERGHGHENNRGGQHHDATIHHEHGEVQGKEDENTHSCSEPPADTGSPQPNTNGNNNMSTPGKHTDATFTSSPPREGGDFDYAGMAEQLKEGVGQS
ncbi:uncharacterized protein BP5553_02442 [Venustampulla echinocandica]|uniref:TEA domain-containing protein n=1 Tax=Venustampulla echinocandica TaxID=2656787 RepID=A0A370U3Z1_9HELO|nr:uncharacterized protein BP5553_02442 [Venustampulla echinocandica]RDL42463.1 hypothetical protein BP5553_02442 [Venustampulla echinocandica]